VNRSVNNEQREGCLEKGGWKVSDGPSFFHFSRANSLNWFGGKLMAKDTITKDGEEVVVREDTAKAYRFVRWGELTAAIGLALMVVLLIALLWKWASN
jgi:hypothetical protein